MPRNIVVAITGASGVTYSRRLVEVLLAAGCDVHLIISEAGQAVLSHELDVRIDLESFDATMLKVGDCARLHYHNYRDYLAPLASGSFATDGMVVCPCSCSTLGAIAGGVATNLIHRAAEVHLKERRKLVLVPRETPLSLVQIENMKHATLAGAVILPASPAFYHGVTSVDELVDFVVARICDQLAVTHTLIRPWGVS